MDPAFWCEEIQGMSEAHMLILGHPKGVEAA